MKMDMLQGTKLDWYVNDMHRLKESTLKRHFPQLLLVVESNYLPHSEVFVFNRVYTP
jgi:hypothetical protein